MEQDNSQAGSAIDGFTVQAEVRWRRCSTISPGDAQFRAAVEKRVRRDQGLFQPGPAGARQAGAEGDRSQVGRPFDSAVSTIQAPGRTPGASRLSQGFSAMLTLDTVRKRFGSLIAVDGLSLDLSARARFSACSGRTAPARARPSHGGRACSTDSGHGRRRRPRRSREARRAAPRIGVAPQALPLYDLLTGEENLRFFGEIYGLPRRRLRRGSPGRWTSSASPIAGTIASRRYSGGMKRRLNIAAALRARSGAGAARRADGRRRPAVAQRDLRQHRGAARARAARSSTPRTTWRRRSGSAIASPSSTTASCSRSDTLARAPRRARRAADARRAHRRRRGALPDRRSARRAQSPVAAQRARCASSRWTPTLEQVFLRLTGRT